MIRAIIFVVLMSGGLVAAVSSRFGALLVYLWFALFRPAEWVWFDITSLRLSLVLGLLLVVPSLATGILPNLTHPLSLGSIAFLLTGIIAQSNAVRPDVGWMWLDFLGRLVAVSLFLVTLVNSKRRFTLTICVIAGSLAISRRRRVFRRFSQVVRCSLKGSRERFPTITDMGWPL